jgi:predicted dehydrogenase
VINAAAVGPGGRGRNLVECTQGKTDKIRFTTGVVRTPDRARDFARAHDLALVTDYAGTPADPAVDAVVIATPHTQSPVLEAIVTSARSGRRERID